MKKIVTHIFPDLDAIASVWLLKRFDDNWVDAEVEFVAAGTTYKKQTVDIDPDIIHVDTGMGRFDHHQLEEKTSAAEIIFNYLKSEKSISLKYQSALERLVNLITQIDNFEDFYWIEPDNDRYDLCLHHLFDHLKLSNKVDDKELVEIGMKLLDAVLFGLRLKVKTEEEIKNGIEFQTVWGRSLGIETKLSRVLKLAQKKGFHLVVKKEPETQFVSIKSQPRKELDLTKAYNALQEKDSEADWFFHKSRHIILNGSRHNPDVKPSQLGLNEIINILKEIK